MIEVDRIGRIGQLTIFFKQIEHAIKSGEVRLERRCARGECLDGTKQQHEVGQEHHQITDGDGSIQHLESTVEQQRGAGDRYSQRPDGLGDP